MPFPGPSRTRQTISSPAATCVACLLKDASISRGTLIEVFEQLAGKAGYLSLDTCAACKIFKAVIRPA